MQGEKLNQKAHDIVINCDWIERTSTLAEDLGVAHKPLSLEAYQYNENTDNDLLRYLFYGPDDFK
jgi:hypothetical protein